MSHILLWYFLRQYGLWFMGFIGVALFAGFLGELAELLRINATGKDFSFALMLRLTSYKMPQLVSDVLPFIFLLATSGFFLRIGESHELLVARLAGLSLWHVLAPLCALAFVVNLFNIGILSSLGSKYFATYWEVRNAAENRPPPQATRVFGLWLYQDRPDGYHIFHARALNLESRRLGKVTIFAFAPDGAWQARWDAPRAAWLPAEDANDDSADAASAAWFWRLEEPTETLISGKEQPATRRDFPIDLAPHKFGQRFPSPLAISFWELAELIETAEALDLPSQTYRLLWHQFFATTLLLWTMIGLAGFFGIRQAAARRASGGHVLERFALVGGLAIGIVLFFLVDFLQGLGIAGRLPPAMAAWAPPLMTLLLVTAALWQVEDTR